jgi:hypothetical protein
MVEARSEPSPIRAWEMSVPHSGSTRICCATLALCLGEYRKRYACDSGLDVAQEYRTHVRYPELALEGFKDLAAEACARGWSMDRHGIRTVFDQESKRLKQVELPGLGRERVSLDTYADTLPAREAEFRREAKYCAWSEPGSNVLR